MNKKRTSSQADLSHTTGRIAPAAGALEDWNPIGSDFGGHYENRSCLRPNLLGCGTKTYLKIGKSCARRVSNKARNTKSAQKRSDLGSKSSPNRLFMGVSSYEICSKLNSRCLLMSEPGFAATFESGRARL